MATYILKAADGRSYGPAGIDELRVWLAQGRLTPDSILEDAESGETYSAGLVPGLFSDPSVPPVAPPMGTGSRPVSAADHMIPSRNVNALWAYYVGLFSIVPCLGLILGPIALVLGRKGLRTADTLPERIGRGHAMTGLILGSVGSLISYGLLVLAIVGIVSSSMRTP